MTENAERAVAYIWSYRVKPEWIARFRAAYGPDGEWASFFARSEAYRGTELFESETAAGQFMTIDYFATPDAREALVSAHASDYAAIDKKWEAATNEETFLGAYRPPRRQDG